MEATPSTTATPAPAAPERKKRPIWKRILRAFLWLSGTFVLLLLIAILLAWIYRDEVKKYVVAEVNKRLNTVVIVQPDDIDLTVLRTFPNLALEFRNVKALDAIKSARKDTLFSAGRIDLQFNLLDLFRSNYRIHSIGVDKVKLNMWVDKNGIDNFHFLKKPEGDAQQDTAKVLFALEDIRLSNVRVIYKDRRSNDDIDVDLHDAQLSGKFGSDEYDLESNINVLLHHYRSKGTTYLSEQNGNLDVVVHVDSRNERYTLQHCGLKLSGFGLNVAGSVQNAPKAVVFDLKASGDKLDAQSTLSLLPLSWRNALQGFESEGEFYFNASINGRYSEAESPVVKADFGVRKGAKIWKTGSNVQLTDVEMKGSFSNEPGKSHFALQPFRFSLQNSSFSGNFRIDNFDQPDVSIDMNGKQQLADLKNFLSIDSLETMAGTAGFSNISIRGKLPRLYNLGVSDFSGFKASGKITLADASFHQKGSPMKFSAVNGNFEFDGPDVSIESFGGNISGSDFALKGAFKNLIAWAWLPDQDLNIDASLESKNILIDPLLEASSSTPSDTGTHLRISPHLQLNLNSKVDQLKWGKFTATGISGNLSLRNSKLVINPVSFRTMDGSLSGSGMIDGSKGDTLLITCDAKADKLNITKVFADLGNFGQTTLTDQHLKGTITADIQFASVWNDKLVADMDKIYSRAAITIDDGELNNFEPMKELSSYMKMQDFNKISFSRWENEIEIRNQKIIIPKNDIQSSAMNITMSGTHGFDNTIDYHFCIKLSELLSKRAKTAKKENSEFGEEIDDGGERKMSICFSMTGTVDNPVIKYDRKAAVQKFTENLKSEKQNLKQILNEEFGWFKKDSTLSKEQRKEDKKKDQEGSFIIEWDDEEGAPKKPATTPAAKGSATEPKKPDPKTTDPKKNNDNRRKEKKEKTEDLEDDGFN